MIWPSNKWTIALSLNFLLVVEKMSNGVLVHLFWGWHQIENTFWDNLYKLSNYVNKIERFFWIFWPARIIWTLTSHRIKWSLRFAGDKVTNFLGLLKKDPTLADFVFFAPLPVYSYFSGNDSDIYDLWVPDKCVLLRNRYYLTNSLLKALICKA